MKKLSIILVITSIFFCLNAAKPNKPQIRIDSLAVENNALKALVESQSLFVEQLLQTTQSQADSISIMQKQIQELQIIVENIKLFEAKNNLMKGICGSNITWFFEPDNGTLTIEGNGRMYDYLLDNNPWMEFCFMINRVIITDGISHIGQSAFSSCVNLKHIELPLSIRTIGSHAFYNCSSLETAIVPEGVVEIEEKTFYECKSLKSISFPSSLLRIGAYAFRYCVALTSINLPDSVEELGDVCFNNCRELSNIKLSSHLKTIPPSAFSGTKVTQLEIPYGVESIEELAFMDCKDLTTVILPATLKYIGKSAFSGCEKLTKVNISPKLTIEKNAFSNTPLSDRP